MTYDELDELVATLPVGDIHHGERFTVWYSANDGIWKWSRES